MSPVQEILKIGLVPAATLTAQEVPAVAAVLEQSGVPCIALQNPTPQIVAAFKNRSHFLVGVYAPAAAKDLVAGVQFAVGESFSDALQSIAKEIGFPLVRLKELPGGILRLDSPVTGVAAWQETLGVRLKKAVQDMLGFTLRHVGINCPDETQSSAVAGTFERIFGLPKEDRGGAYFAGDIIEVMKTPFYGTHGHIAIATNSAESAAYHLEKSGVKLNWNSAGYNPDGHLRVVYLQDEIGGFAVHILQK